MRNFIKEIKEGVLVYDGSKGTMLHKYGMQGGECPELWNVTHRDEVRKIYEAYKEAGADVIQTNTFQGSRMKLEEYSLGDRVYELNFEGTKLAKEVMGDKGFVAASIGPLGKLFEPSGELTFNAAHEAFKEQVKAVVEGGADIVNFETFTDLSEMRAALLAARDVTDIPVICSIAFESNGKTLMGTDPYIAALVLKSLGADMIGTNCSFGPLHLLEIVKKMHEVGGIYICAKPNAGLPQLVDGKAVYNEPVDKFAALAPEFVKYGVRLLGGCCGTTPEYIKAVRSGMENCEVPRVKSRSLQAITSGVKLLNIEASKGLNLGRLDAEKDQELVDELSKGNMEFIVDKAMDLSCERYDAIYVNIDKVGGNDMLLADVVNAAQGYIREPFIIETKDSRALSNVLRLYRGKAGVVVDGYEHNIMEELLEAAKRFGSTVISRDMI